MNQEWKVLLDGKLYSDRLNEEWLAKCHVEEEVEKGVADESRFEVMKMTKSEMKLYL